MAGEIFKIAEQSSFLPEREENYLEIINEINKYGIKEIYYLTETYQLPEGYIKSFDVQRLKDRDEMWRYLYFKNPGDDFMDIPDGIDEDLPF